jgi:hypothetical protein
MPELWKRNSRLSGGMPYLYDVWGIALWINYSFFCLDAKERTKEKIKAAFM